MYHIEEADVVIIGAGANGTDKQRIFRRIRIFMDNR